MATSTFLAASPSIFNRKGNFNLQKRGSLLEGCHPPTVPKPNSPTIQEIEFHHWMSVDMRKNEKHAAEADSGNPPRMHVMDAFSATIHMYL